jgi:hypothetical protein
MEKAMKTRKQTKEPAADTGATPEVIGYEDAVLEGKQIVLNASQGQLRLGELAHKVETKYADRTVAKFAAEIGVSACTLHRYRDVYRAWEEDICAPGRKSVPSYAVLLELAAHPDRSEIIHKNPDITRREAHYLAREQRYAEEEQQQEEQQNNWRKDNRRWFRELYNHTQEVSRMVEVAVNSTPEKQRELLPVFEPLFLTNMRGCGGMLIKFVDHFEALLGGARANDVEALIEPTDREVIVQMAAE